MKTFLQLTAAAALLFGGVAYVQADNCQCGGGTCWGDIPWNSTETPCGGVMYVTGRDSPKELGVASVSNSYNGAQAWGWSDVYNLDVWDCSAEPKYNNGQTAWSYDKTCFSGAPAYLSKVKYNLHND